MIVEVWLACALVNGQGVQCAVFDTYETCSAVQEVVEKNAAVMGFSQCAPVKMEFPDKRTSVRGAGVTRVSCAVPVEKDVARDAR